MKELTRKMVDAVGDAFNANDIDEVIPVVTIAIEFYGNTKELTFYLEN